MIWRLRTVIVLASLWGLEAAVQTLTKETLSSFLESNPVAVVEFYAPWCGHCKKFAPIYDEASDILEMEGIPLAKVDCVEETSLYWSNDITGFPTVKVFLRGEPILYEGARELNDIVSFIRDISAPSVVLIEHGDDALIEFIRTQLQRTKPQVLCSPGGGSTGQLVIDAFELACKRVGRLGCGLLSDASQITVYAETDATTIHLPRFDMLRLFDEPDEQAVVTAPFGGHDMSTESVSSFAAKLAAWMASWSYPVVTEFTRENDELLFAQDRPGFHTHVILLADKGAHVSVLQAFREVSASFHSRCVFVLMDVGKVNTEDYVGNAAAGLGLSASKAPEVMIVKSAQTKVEFFKSSFQAENISEESLSAFVDDFFSGRLEPSRVIES